MGFGIKRRIKNLLDSSAKKRGLVKTSPMEWSIAMFEGSSYINLRPLNGITTPVLTKEDVKDVRAAFVADPFMVRTKDSWYMFFEVLNQETQKGEIGYATSIDGSSWVYQKIILAERHHLSYPYVFEWKNEFYMAPQGSNDEVTLYKAAHFPDQWHKTAVLLKGGRYADSSIFRYHDKWWMYTDASPSPQSPLLKLYYATELTGPWIEHPCNPLADGDARFSRPSGRVIIHDGAPIRFTQNVFPSYGREVSAFKITELTPENYQEHALGDGPILSAGSFGWNSHGMHHVDAHQLGDGKWLACVDGHIDLRQKSDQLRTK